MLNQRPWIAWCVAAVAVAVTVAMLTGVFSSQEPDSVERRSQDVTIRCTETGKEWTMNRGEFERQLMTMHGQIDPTKGIPSPYADGRLTGVLVDKKDWEETVERINRKKARRSGG